MRPRPGSFLAHGPLNLFVGVVAKDLQDLQRHSLVVSDPDTHRGISVNNVHPGLHGRFFPRSSPVLCRIGRPPQADKLNGRLDHGTIVAGHSRRPVTHIESMSRTYSFLTFRQFGSAPARSNDYPRARHLWLRPSARDLVAGALLLQRSAQRVEDVLKRESVPSGTDLRPALISSARPFGVVDFEAVGHDQAGPGRRLVSVHCW